MSYDFSTINLLHAIREITISVLNSSEKYILTMILSCVDQENKSWYSMISLAKFCCMDKTRIRPHIKSLEKKNFIKINKPLVYGRKKTNEYSVNIELIMSFHLTLKGCKTHPFNEKRGAKRILKGVQNASPILNRRGKEEDASARASSEALHREPTEIQKQMIEFRKTNAHLYPQTNHENIIPINKKVNK